MAQIYVLVRYAQLILSGVMLILGIVELVNELNGTFGYDKTYVAYLSISIIILFVGAYGSYTHRREYLLTFALILIIAIITGFFTQKIHYSPLGTSIVLVILALTQAQLIRLGYN